MESMGLRRSDAGGREAGSLYSASSWRGWKVVKNVSLLTCGVILKREKSQGLESRRGMLSVAFA